MGSQIWFADKALRQADSWGRQMQLPGALNTLLYACLQTQETRGENTWLKTSWNQNKYCGMAEVPQSKQDRNSRTPFLRLLS